MVTSSTSYPPARIQPTDQFAIGELDKIADCDLDQLQRLQYFEIIWVRIGEGTLFIDESSVLMKSENVYCLGPGQVRRIVVNPNVKGYYLRISPELLHLIHNQFDLSYMLTYSVAVLQPVTEAEALSRLQEVVVLLLKEFGRDNNDSRMELIKGFLRVFMIYLWQNFDTEQKQPLDANAMILKRFVDLLKKQITVKKMVSQYADDLCVTPNYLNSVIKKITGLTASHYIQQHIVQEAKRQAIYSGMRMKEIAFQLGFDDQAHFSKFFKNYSGINFTTFRKELASQ